MSPAMKALLRQRDDIAIQSLERLKILAPRVYDLVVARLQSTNSKPYQGMSGLGAESDFSWTEFGLDIVSTYADVRALQMLNAEERKVAELELRKIQEQNAAIQEQLRLQQQLEQSKQQTLTLQQKAALAGESVIDQFFAQPWALPAIVGLGFMLWRSMSGRRRRG